MRETQNLQLTQFDPGDKPRWLEDYNGDMLLIDEAVASKLPNLTTATPTSGSTLPFTAGGAFAEFNKKLNRTTVLRNTTIDVSGGLVEIATLQHQVGIVWVRGYTVSGTSIDLLIPVNSTSINNSAAYSFIYPHSDNEIYAAHRVENGTSFKFGIFGATSYINWVAMWEDKS